jgi:hypothetical protein
MINIFTDAYNYTTGGIPLGKIATSILIVLIAFLVRGILRSVLKKAEKKNTGFFGTLARDFVKPAAFLTIILGISNESHRFSCGADGLGCRKYGIKDG